jgi:branched-chain amino acid transport system ATP-binding protein
VERVAENFAETVSPVVGPGKTALLRIDRIEVRYKGGSLAVRDASIDVMQQECIGLLGANGAGKSTVLKCISSMIGAEGGAISSGDILLEGRSVLANEPEKNLGLGIAHVMEGRCPLPHLTVHQNLIVGGHIVKESRRFRMVLEKVFETIPRLADLRDRVAGYLSGGEQQLLVIGRALMSEPRILLLDEPSLGLAPLMIREIYALLGRLKASGMTLVIVEQELTAIRELADMVYLMEDGVIVNRGSPRSVLDSGTVKDTLFGAQGRRSFTYLRGPEWRPLKTLSARDRPTTSIA